ncbi:biopolymer transporter ExbD [Shimia sp. R9_1]|uniref:ExbD/TolR family protein n=1 Tax=unclassified Shimia TaxID=2630038 RepID=UPI001ADCF313|nr:MULTISPECIES: biopolymer transporter ExbD [unclassified Shimia]MBO9398520.1 biopolymer transporter ExbD [Shimia sp. R9_2]MBO9402659.1 biopolymer transporter ExbD [Shimia sp. R9_3]MBO9409400.1 biopolymer transporter ExbD [Shimia sp. R9_1]
MRIATAPKRAAAESVIPMINVVFLLLIFFLMTAQITPPEPFEVSPPAADLDTPADGQAILHVSAEGELAYQEARGEADVLAALTDYPENEPLMLRADRAVSAQEIAALLPKLAAAGVRDLKLVSALQ